MSDPSAPLTSTTEFYQPVQVWTVAPPRQRYWLHALLLVATFFTMLIVGARMEDNFLHNEPVFSVHQNDGAFAFFPVSWLFTQPTHVLLGLPFSLTLILILFAHEMGHYLYCRHYGVNATLPFFLPAPTLFGTFGAFIRIRGPIRSRTALFDIGIAGPIAGFVVALLVLAFSLGLSKPLLGAIPEQEVQLGYPLIFYVVQRAVNFLSPAHPLAQLSAVYLHPVAIAAWVGMFATALNLLPGGQLDGGHIVFSIAPRAHKFISRLTILILIPLAVYRWTGWLIWAILLEISSFRHPQVADWPRVRGVRAWLAVFGVIMLIVTLAPAPLADSSLREMVRLWRGH